MREFGRQLAKPIFNKLLDSVSVLSVSITDSTEWNQPITRGEEFQSRFDNSIPARRANQAVAAATTVAIRKPLTSKLASNPDWSSDASVKTGDETSYT